LETFRGSTTLQPAFQDADGQARPLPDQESDTYERMIQGKAIENSRNRNRKISEVSNSGVHNFGDIRNTYVPGLGNRFVAVLYIVTTVMLSV
jgi:hypothetical protein